jgi:hypothetical protein
MLGAHIDQQIEKNQVIDFTRGSLTARNIEIPCIFRARLPTLESDGGRNWDS